VRLISEGELEASGWRWLVPDIESPDRVPELGSMFEAANITVCIDIKAYAYS
jgi:hypothetical protein